MSLNKEISVISINDVIAILKDWEERNSSLDIPLEFASDLTGISIDALMEMMDAC